MRHAVPIAALIAALIAAAPEPAHAYRFAVRARTMAQVYQLRGFRLVGADVLYARRRFGQALSLAIWDIGDFAARRRSLDDPDGARGPIVTWHSHLRLDHEFGSWATGNDSAGAGALVDALDLIPELDESVLGLDLLYGYLTIDNLWRDRVTLRIGRQLGLDGFDAWAVDGATVTMRPPVLPIAIEAMAGLRVRDTSPVAPAAVELDGTSGADCREYVEGAVPGDGHWRLIDRSTAIEDRRLASDQMYCPQRDVWMPTAGIALATRDLKRWSARLSYRRTDSSTVGLIGPVDRLDYLDTGLYPNEAGQAPERGVNEERIAAMARADLRAGDHLRIAPWTHARASLVHRLIDRAAIGADLMIGDDHVITPEVAYRVPTWDADSIFNVFEVLPTTDVKLGWTTGGAGATAWLRRYHGGGDEAGAAYGIEAEAARAFDKQWSARASAIADGGWGGTRVGATATASYGRALERDRRVVATASLAGWRFDPDDDDGARDHGVWYEGIAQGRVSWAFLRTALHGVVETTTTRDVPIGVRVMGVLDLAFEPEM